MTLSEIRNLLVELSGRPDLVQAGAVLTADMLIDEARKELDRRLFGGKAEGRYTVDITSGQILVPIPYCRAIKEVWLYGADGKVHLSKADSSNEIKEYYTLPKASTEQGTPAVYFPLNSRHVPEAATPSDFNQTQAFDDILYSTPEHPALPLNYVVMNGGGTLTISQSGKYIFINNTVPVTITLPDASDIAHLGVNYGIRKVGIGRVTIQLQGDDVLNDSSAAGTMYCDDVTAADMNVVFTGAATWVGSGSGIWVTT